MSKSNQIAVSYKTSVLVPAGWRSITVTALLELSKSGKMGKVIDVLDVDGDGTSGYTSRTGANRQKYNLTYIATRELGQNKRISSCEVL